MRCLVHLAVVAPCFAVMKREEVKANQGAPLKQKMPWYRTGDEIHDLLSELSQAGCNGANFKFSTRSQVNSAEAAGTEVSLDVVKISKSGSSGAPKQKAFFVFGEHARELITGESAVDFVQTLCGNGREAERAARVLETTDFTIIPNANPVSRKKVEGGMYCKRTNEDGVDLNRNWSDEHRDAEVKGDEMNPGPHGFSEPETQLLKSMVDEERPDIYLSIHSGAYLLGTPFGRATSPVPEGQQEMIDVLGPISEKYCAGNCPYGDLADLIGYKSVGCDIDYVKESLNVPYVYTWEIYVGPEIRTRYIEEARERRGAGSMSQESKAFFKENSQLNFQQRGSRKRRMHERQNFLQASAVTKMKSKVRTPEMDEDVDSCNDQFNPPTAQETQEVAENWTGAYLELCEEVAAKRQGKTSGVAPAAPAAPAATATESFSATTPVDPFAAIMQPALESASATIPAAASDNASAMATGATQAAPAAQPVTDTLSAGGADSKADSGKALSDFLSMRNVLGTNSDWFGK